MSTQLVLCATCDEQVSKRTAMRHQKNTALCTKRLSRAAKEGSSVEYECCECAKAFARKTRLAEHLTTKQACTRRESTTTSPKTAVEAMAKPASSKGQPSAPVASSSSESTDSPAPTGSKKCRSRFAGDTEKWCKGCKQKQRCTNFPSDSIIKKRRTPSDGSAMKKKEKSIRQNIPLEKKVVKVEKVEKGDRKRRSPPLLNVKKIAKNSSLKDLCSKEMFALLPVAAQRELAALLPYCDSKGVATDAAQFQLPFSAMKNEYLTAFFDSYLTELDYGWILKDGSDGVNYDQLSSHLPDYFDGVKLSQFEPFFEQRVQQLRILESAIWDRDCADERAPILRRDAVASLLTPSSNSAACHNGSVCRPQGQSPVSLFSSD